MKRIKSRLTKTAVVYGALSVFLLVFDNVYAIFGHGVRSAYMTWASPVLLLLGTAPFVLLRLFAPAAPERAAYRLFLNVYSGGNALLIIGMLLRGVLDIAGGTSDIAPWFFVLSFPLLFSGLTLLVRVLHVGKPIGN